MNTLLVLTLLCLADSCLGGGGYGSCGSYWGNHLPGPPGYVAPVEGECGCCPPPCCCTCVETEIPQTTTTTTTSTTTTTTPEIMCEYQLDLAFIVDSSYNIPNKIDWQLVKLWVLDITNIISVIGPAGVLVGMVTYATNASTAWNFASPKTQNITALHDAITDLELLGGFTNTPEALEKVNTEVFNTAGDRDWPVNSNAIPNVVVIITTGRANMRLHEYERLANELKKTATVIVFGDIRMVNKSELQILASNDDLIFAMNDLVTMSYLLNDMRRAVCDIPAVVTKPPTSPPPSRPPLLQKECFCCCPPPPGYPDVGYHHEAPKSYHTPYGCPCL